MEAADNLAAVVRRLLTPPDDRQTRWDAGRIGWQERQELEKALNEYEAQLED